MGSSRALLRSHPTFTSPPISLRGSLLRGADEIGLRKPVKAEFGGGTRSFSCEEDYIYENIENELFFFSSQVGTAGPARGLWHSGGTLALQWGQASALAVLLACRAGIGAVE